MTVSISSLPIPLLSRSPARRPHSASSKAWSPSPRPVSISAVESPTRTTKDPTFILISPCSFSWSEYLTHSSGSTFGKKSDGLKWIWPSVIEVISASPTRTE